MKALVIAYVMLMPFMSALAPADFLPLPLLFLVAIAPFILIRRSSLLDDLRSDAGFLLAFALGCLAMLASPLPLGPKNFNYTAAVLVSYLMFFVVVRAWLRQPRISWGLICSAAHTSLAVLSVAIIFEFYLASFHGVFFADLIHFAHTDLNVSDLVTSDFKRPRAFAVEPGFTALCFECLWPLAFSDFAAPRRRWRHVLYGCAFMLLASAAAIASLTIALVFVWASRDRDLRGLLKLGSAVLALVLVVGTTEIGQEVAWSVMGRKLDIVSLDATPGDSAVTVFDRLTTYQIGVELLQDKPFGIGWGTLGQAFFTGAALPQVGKLGGSGMLCLYLDVAVASGLLGLLAFLWFVGWRIVAVLKSDHPLAKQLAVALIALCIHHGLVTEFQFPFIWFALALADKMTRPRRLAAARRMSAASPALVPPKPTTSLTGKSGQLTN